MASNQQKDDMRETLIDIRQACTDQIHALSILARQIDAETPDAVALEAASAKLASEARHTALLAQHIYAAARDLQRAA